MAADVFKCTKCVSFLAINLRILMNHLYTVHTNSNVLHTICPIRGCSSTFKRYNSLYKHVLSLHKDIYSSNSIASSDISVTDDTSNSTALLENNVLEEQQNDITSTTCESDDEIATLNGSDGDIAEPDDDSNLDEIEDIQKSSALFLLRIKERNKLSQVTINDIRSETETLLSRISTNLVQKIQESTLTDEHKDEVYNILSETVNPFQGLQSEALHSKYIKENLHYVEFEEVTLGRKLIRKKQNNKISIQEIDENFIYIPLIKTLEQMLCNKRIRNLILKPPVFSRNNVFYDVCDGLLFRSDPYFQTHKDALALVLYHDELEVCNPLSSKAGVHKLDMYYFSIANLSPKFRSKRCANRLLGIAKANLVKKYGIDGILKPIIDDLKSLYEGISVNINGFQKQIFGKVIFCAGDTLGQHLIGGFKEGVGVSVQKCRNCYCQFDQMQKLFKDSLFVKRTKERHLEECNFIERATNDQVKQDLMTTFGITRKSLLMELPNFDIIRQLPQDIMHIVLEGVAQYEIRLVLLHFLNNGDLSLKDLNASISQHPYGYTEVNDKPNPLRDTVFYGDERYKLKYKAVQAWVFLRLLPFILTPFINTDSLYYKFLTELIEIVSIIFSPVIKKDTTEYLKSLISKHLKTFVNLFPEKNVLPKQHYMIHVPGLICDLGPPIRSSCFSFEASHLYFKNLARKQNFKNITKSLAKRHQLFDCANYGNTFEKSCSHPLFACEKKIGKVKEVSNDERLIFRSRLDEYSHLPGIDLPNLQTVSWVQLYGTKFCHDAVISIDVDNTNMEPIFGRIVKIWHVMGYIYFETKRYETVRFCDTFQSFLVENTDEICLTPYESLVDYSVYHSKVNYRGSVYVPVKYYIYDLIEEHIIEENPIHE